MKARLYYIHDPMCSWCWGFRPTWGKLLVELEGDIEVHYVLGGLAADSDEPMPLTMQQAIQGYWRKIQGLLGTEFNFDFWEKCAPRRSTYPACRAVIAAERQGASLAMSEVIQRAYYLRAMNPSDTETLAQLADELSLDVARFQADLLSAETNVELMRQIAFAEQLPVRGLPSLVLEYKDEYWPIPVNYQDCRSMLKLIGSVQ